MSSDKKKTDPLSSLGDSLANTNDNTRFIKLLENSREGVSLLDKDLKIIYRSISAERINGWDNTERAQRGMSELVHPDDLANLTALIRKVSISPGLCQTIVFRSRHFLGHFIWLDATFTNFLDDIDINAIVCNFRDVTQKKQDEELLQQTVKELFVYKYTLDEASIVAITDQNGIIMHVNDNFCRISKYSEAELIGQDLRIINSVYHEQAFIRNLWATIAQGDTWTGELKNKAKDGSYYWVDTTIVPFLNEQGKPYQYVAIWSDISERKLNEQKIIESEHFTKTITDNLPALIAYFDADLYCLFANKPYMDWFEKQPHEILGVNKRDILDSREFKLHEFHILEVLKGKPQRFERAFHKADGQAIDTDTQYLPDIEDGKVKGFFSLIYDVTEIKLVEVEVKKKTEQIENILESITDGFLAIDSDMRYTYGNKMVEAIFGVPVSAILGKTPQEIFPGVVETETYKSIKKALDKKIPVFNEDYYAPLNLWLENRVFPASDGVSIFIRDITKQKQEEQHLKLLESVITNTTDAILITEAEPLDEPGPRTVYVNDAFTKMTGYTAEDIMGKTPRILQGLKSDQSELRRLDECLKRKEACEITTINYKKNGEEFWINFAVSPVYNNQGTCTHFIAIEREVSERKNDELQKALLSEISLIFNEHLELNDMLLKVLERLAEFGNFCMAEAWLIGEDKNRINLVAKFPKNDAKQVFYQDSAGIKNFTKGAGLPGKTWETQTIQFWQNLGENEHFGHRDPAKNSRLQSAYGLPLKHNGIVLGMLVLGLNSAENQGSAFTKLFESFSEHFGAEIKRKQLEQELNQVFNFTPDILCIANTDGYFKKVNPAMAAILEYSENELLARPFMEFVHSLDKDKTASELENIITGNPTYYIENRYIAKSGKVKWLAWTTTGASEQGTFYCSARHITDKKELEDLLNRAISLARIGAWEVDLEKRSIQWSDMTREIHELDGGVEITIEDGTNFYKEGENRDAIVNAMEDAVLNGTSSDLELQIVTAKGNLRWVRVIIESELSGGKCFRLYGSFQDIDARKKAEIGSLEALEERNTILESIDDAFFAVDKNWTVTYWNNMAEKVLQTPKENILNSNLWEIFSGSVDSISYKKYHGAVETNQAAHFEDFFEPLNRWFEISAYPSETGLAVYFKDISDRKLSESLLKELNQNLQKHAKELAISNAELEQFAYVASHDLQEPLRMVTSFMTQLEKKYGDVVDEKGRQYIHFAVDGAKRMRQIILDLLDFSRVGRAEDDLEEIDFNSLVGEILALYRRQIEEEHATVTFENLPKLKTYKTPIRQVFQNLVSNSLKYHKAGIPSVINISCKETKTHYQFSVKDNGIGIAPEYFDKIFIIFQRLHNKDEYSGTGMGLAIAKKIIENLGGKILVESQEGRGSTFCFSLLKSYKT